jgi:predicted DCC family thiol-disulfide oxidoreductase YuxK
MTMPAAPGSGRGVHLVLYDGVCGLCNFACQFILARDRAGIFDFASLQSATGRAWLERFNRPTQSLDTFCLVTDYQTAPAMLDKSDAALAVLSRLGAPWSWLTIFRVLPTGLRDALYDFVARHRYRWFGRYDVCLIPSPQQRARFLDV